MSSTNRGAERAESDNYPTPAWVVDRLLDAMGAQGLPGGRWLEPCAGEGSIIRTVNARRRDVKWTAVELRDCREAIQRAAIDDSGRTNPADHQAPEIIAPQDFLTWDPAGQSWDVILTNPPYSIAREFIDKCLQLAPIVAMPLRLNFLGSEDRFEWWGKVKLPDLYVLPNRPDFSGLGGDSCEYAWFVWDRLDGPAQVHLLGITPDDVRLSQRPAGWQEARERAKAAKATKARNKAEALLGPTIAPTPAAVEAPVPAEETPRAAVSS